MEGGERRWMEVGERGVGGMRLWEIWDISDGLGGPILIVIS